MGMSPDDTTQAMYMSFPTEVEGISKGWMSGGTAERGKEEVQSISRIKATVDA